LAGSVMCRTISPDDNNEDDDSTNENCGESEVQSGNMECDSEDEYEEGEDSSDEGSVEANEPFEAHISIDADVGSDYRSSSELNSPVNSSGRRVTVDLEFREDIDMERV
ncbi:MAG: hypothetical protein Q8761_02990, partial [Sweet potato little leaf phytoplasma]|nr:hypothetical protein [Sweet potato little leaf phytoplasma]